MSASENRSNFRRGTGTHPANGYMPMRGGIRK